jgi:hypothetical protein
VVEVCCAGDFWRWPSPGVIFGAPRNARSRARRNRAAVPNFSSDPANEYFADGSPKTLPTLCRVWAVCASLPAPRRSHLRKAAQYQEGDPTASRVRRGGQRSQRRSAYQDQRTAGAHGRWIPHLVNSFRG